MRKAHQEVGLSADDARAWHESGHTLMAAAIGILFEVVLDESSGLTGGLTIVKPLPGTAAEDVLIAVMGPAAQLAYMTTSNKQQPSMFTQKWFRSPALSELRHLKERWPNVRISDANLLDLVRSIAVRLRENEEMITLLEVCSIELRKKQKLTKTEVLAIIGDKIQATRDFFEGVKPYVSALTTTTVRKVIPVNGIARLKPTTHQKENVAKTRKK